MIFQKSTLCDFQREARGIALMRSVATWPSDGGIILGHLARHLADGLNGQEVTIVRSWFPHARTSRSSTPQLQLRMCLSDAVRPGQLEIPHIRMGRP